MAVSINELISLNASDSSFNSYPSLDLRYGPYDNVSAALTALTSSKRCVGLTVGIKKTILLLNTGLKEEYKILI